MPISRDAGSHYCARGGGQADNGTRRRGDYGTCRRGYCEVR